MKETNLSKVITKDNQNIKDNGKISKYPFLPSINIYHDKYFYREQYGTIIGDQG